MLFQKKVNSIFQNKLGYIYDPLNEFKCKTKTILRLFVVFVNGMIFRPFKHLLRVIASLNLFIVQI